MRYTPAIQSVTESPLVRIGVLAESIPDSINLCYGESDMPTPEFITRAAYDAARAGHTFYTNTAGYSALREAIANKIRELHNVTYKPSEILVTVGASMGIYAAVCSLVAQGDNAIVIEPTYSIFGNDVSLSGGEPRRVPLARNGNTFTLDLDAIRAAIDDRTRMIIVNSPSNPSGWIATPDEQRALYDLALEHDLVILADEVYDRLAFDTPIARSFAEVAEDKEHIVVVNSFSKTYNMTGWRLGWVQASERLINLMTSAVEFMTSNATAMVQQAGIVALRDGESYVAELRDHYAARRAQVMSALTGIPGLVTSEPRGAFFAFPRVDGLRDSAELAMDLLRQSGVAVAPGTAFGVSGEGHIRICFASSERKLAQGLERLGEYFRSR